jgi:uncharacterized LabA/DUF88 family protein
MQDSPNDSGQARVAIFLDAENLIIEAQKIGLPVEIKLIVDRVREEGLLNFARAYADWTDSHTLPYTGDFYNNVFELTQLNSRYGKNTGDIQLVVDALEMALLPNSPEIFVIVAGDRDFVPLVQKLKRYGKRVIGIGLQEASSHTLQRVCNVFLYYERLVPDEAAPDQPVQRETALASPAAISEAKPALAAPVPAAASATGQPTATPPTATSELSEDLREAFELLLRAVVSLERNARQPSGQHVRYLMQQLDPRFDLSRFTFATFREFVYEAVKHGYVKSPVLEGLDMRLESARAVPIGDSLRPAVFVNRFETAAEALQAYRQIMARKRVPLVKWSERKMLITQLWEEFERSGQPMTLLAASDVMRDGAARFMLRIPDTAIWKIVLSLKIGRALHVVEERYGQDAGQTLVQADCSLEDALFRINATYVRGLRIEEPDLAMNQRGLALLLFDRDGDDEVWEVNRILEEFVYAK